VLQVPRRQPPDGLNGKPVRLRFTRGPFRRCPRNGKRVTAQHQATVHPHGKALRGEDSPLASPETGLSRELDTAEGDVTVPVPPVSDSLPLSQP
jgi:hypothetical protein